MVHAETVELPPYHPATNRAAESLVQSFKQSLRKSSLTPTAAVQEFRRQYCHTPLDAGYSPSELVNGRQIQSDLDTLFSSLLKASKLKMLPGFKYGRLLAKCLDSNAGTLKGPKEGHAATVDTCSHDQGVWDAYCKSSFRAPGTDMATAYLSAMPRIQNQPRGRSGRDAFQSGNTRYDSYWGRCTHKRCTITTAPSWDVPRRKLRNWQLPNDDQFGMHNPRRSKRMWRTHIPTGQHASEWLSAGGKMLCYGNESLGTFQPRLALTGPN